MNNATIDGNLYVGVTGFAQHGGWLQPIMSACTRPGIVLPGALLAVGWRTARRA